MSRICKKCGVEKPIESFQSRGNGTRRLECRACRRGARRVVGGESWVEMVRACAGRDDDHRICRRCGLEQEIGKFHKIKNGRSYTCSKCWYAKRKKNWKVGACRRCHQPISTELKHCAACLEWQRVRRANVREKVFAHYGQKCVYCMVNELMFLTIDHINGGGNVDHRSGNLSIELERSYRETGVWPEGFQVLCWSCNAAKHIHGEAAVRAVLAARVPR